MKYTPRKYQDFSTRHIIDNPAAGLFLDMGLGKTAATLTAIDELIYDRMEVSKVLIIAPKKVATDTWPDELGKWDHTRHLRFSVVVGTEKQRKQALRSEADIYLINRENVPWLVAHYGGGFMPFDMLVIDELSSFKSAKAQRFKALKMVRPLFKRVVGLTGTPAPNGLVDIWPQVFLLDQGERLGRTITGFRTEYCTEGMKNGHVVYKYHMRKDKQQQVYDKIGDICISMKSEDYLDLPGRIDIDVNVRTDDCVMDAYNDFVRDRVMEMMENSEDGLITAVNAAALTGKLRQFANGAIYDADRAVHKIHDYKLEALEEIVEEAAGKPVLVFYSFKHDLSRIKASKAIGKQVRELKTSQDMKDWNAGKISLLLAHPASAGHGLNLQTGGHIMVWFGLDWSLELYQQACKRLDRPGQVEPVRNYRLLTEGTIDYKVLQALEGKRAGQDSLMDAVKALVDQFT